MVYISKVYTRFGDEGQTKLASGDTVSKASVRVVAYGEIDELNAMLGLVRLELTREVGSKDARTFVDVVDRTLGRVQQELFNLGAELSMPQAEHAGGNHLLADRHVATLESEMDALNEPLEPLRSFVLPGGGPASTASHVARTVCRRAERNVVLLADAEAIRPVVRQYVNRLSDYLFVLSRACAHAFGHDEVLWVPAAASETRT